MLRPSGALGAPKALTPVGVRVWRLHNFIVTRLCRGLWAEICAFFGIGVTARLSATLTRDGVTYDLGIICRRVVTTAGVNALRDALVGTFTLSNLKYHAIGTNNTAEAVGDTALGAEVETRVAGTQAANGAGVYRTVGTLTATAPRAVVEHGIFSQLAVGGTLLDRSVFAVINLAVNDTLTLTYDLTFTAGG